MKRCVGVIGAHRCSDAEAELAFDVGFRLAKAGMVVVSGGLGGVMQHASQGATEGGGVAVGILPGSDPSEANEFVSIAIPTGMGEIRNGLVVRASRALIAIGGSWGTLSELALARRVGKPVIGLASLFPSSLDYPRAETAEEAVDWVLEHLGRPAVG